MSKRSEIIIFVLMIAALAVITVFGVASLCWKQPRFAAKTIDDQIKVGNGFAVGDVDGDDWPDILLADAHQVVWYRNGNWERFVMIENSGVHYTCIAARDMDGDGKVEVAVAMQVRYGETADTTKSESIHRLIRPENPTKPWTSIRLDHGYPVHRMQWVKVGGTAFQLIVLPRNRPKQTNGQQAENIRAYVPPADPDTTWNRRLIMQPMPWAGHLEVQDDGSREVFYIAGDGGIMGFTFEDGRWTLKTADWLARGRQLMEARIGRVASRNTYALAAFEPQSANLLTIYSPRLTDSLLSYNTIGRRVLERKMYEGKGLAMADLLDIKRDQVIAGWNKPNHEGQFGIKLYVPFNQYWEAIDVYWIDRGGIACQDIQVADMDEDGKPDIIALGGATHNLKIYWNRSNPRGQKYNPVSPDR